jgi:hypothetical protein
MYQGKLVFTQLMEILPRAAFDRCVRRHRGDRCLRSFTCRDQFLAMAFAQLTYRESLRDIETCLRAMQPKLYHAGFRCRRIARSTLADANTRRDWRIYADFAQGLITHARALYADEPLAVELGQTIYALDSTLIELCLNLFPWAPSQREKAAVKLHTMIDLRGNIPCFIRVTGTRTADSTILDHLTPEPGAYYLMDRGYLHLERLHRLHEAHARFVMRCRRKITFRRRASREVDRTTGLRSDQTVVFADRRARRKYRDPLRRVTFTDHEHGTRLILLSNDFALPARTIAELYRCRWQIELFFKWIKQHLRIKSFFGTTPNAVKTQVWIAVSTYVLVAILRRELKLEQSMAEILQILSITLFEKTPIKQAFRNHNEPLLTDPCHNQLPLFDF